MKKIIIFALSAFILLGSGIAIGSSINEWHGFPIAKIESNGKPLITDAMDYSPPINIDGHVYVPLYMLRQAGMQVTWNEKISTVDVKQKHELTEAEIAQISRSVALIYVYKDGAYQGQGSGFVINSNFGKVLVSNCHVGCIGNELRITLDGKQYEYKGAPLFANEATDVYGVKIDADVPALSYTTEFPSVKDSVVAIGYPKANYEVNKGAVSYVATVGTRNIDFSAQVKPGASGGLLINSDGKVIGITTQGSPPSGGIIVSEAMPMLYVQDELNKLK